MMSFPWMMIHPRWYWVVDDLMNEANPPNQQAVDALLEAHSSVPPPLRKLEGQLDKLYPGRTRTDVRARLVGNLAPHGTSFNASKLKRLLLDEHGCNIQAVELRKASELEVFLEVLDQATFTRLRSLDLHFAPREEQLETLGAHPKLTGLETLIIRDTLGERIATLSRLPVVVGLRHLGLWHALDGAPQEATDALAAVEFANLHTLGLGTKMRRATARQGRPFIQAPWLDDLRHFALNGFTVCNEDVAALAERSSVAHLESLSLDQGRASAATLCRLLSKLSSCMELDLKHFEVDGSEDPFGVDVAEALVASGCVPNLINLYVGFTPEATELLHSNGLDTDAARDRLEELRGWRM